MGLDGGVRLDELRAAAISIGAADLEAAREGFHRAYKSRSAKRTFHYTQIFALALIASAIAYGIHIAPDLAWPLIRAAAITLFASAILLRLFAAAHLRPLLSRLADTPTCPTYTILCPLYREANVVADLVAALDRLDYPRGALDIKLIVEGDDVDTLAAALAVAGAPHIEVIIVPASAPRTKPKALNAGLIHARGDYVVVYDAEDRPHPAQLRAALDAFEDGPDNLACVQAPLEIDNANASWIARQFAAEYAILFRELLPLLASLRLPFPLGGTSNHFRIDALRAVGGWDPYNVTEDADLGYRLARDRYAAAMIGPPTYEEAPITFRAWLAQRTRWIKGHMQTWLMLMRNPWRTLRELGLRGFLMMQLMLGGGLVAAFAHGPLACIVLIAALSPYKLLSAADFTLALAGLCVAFFAALTASAVSGNFSHLRAALTMPAYWPLATIAAWRALFELVFRPHHWAKTAHGLSQRRRMRAYTAPQRNDFNSAHIASTSASG
ncbi:glycosyltransferase family 2 protein [Terricaulis sp.]|uniref:glycosyltransferase family 2 protein n=1 Tax=Terricaulis sp. TaxID=2768686 RepID=UPI002AC47323|nr:glycosyltransferase [Terricaulis sp.]MDZ4689760.1 glycosyltransferase [Terricaulis sp.]